MLESILLARNGPKQPVHASPHALIGHLLDIRPPRKTNLLI